MAYKDEWLLLEADADIEDTVHREPTEEFFFSLAVASEDVGAGQKYSDIARFGVM